MLDDIAKVIEHPRHSSFVEVAFKGAIDHNSVPRLEALFDKLHLRGFTRFVLDCRDIDFLSSSGFGLFVNLACELKSEEGAGGFVGLPIAQGQTLELIGAHDLFSYFDESKTAIQSFGREQTS